MQSTTNTAILTPALTEVEAYELQVRIAKLRANESAYKRNNVWPHFEASVKSKIADAETKLRMLNLSATA